MRKQMWNKLKRMMAGVMMAALLVTACQGVFKVDDNPGISLYGEVVEQIQYIL